MKKVLTLVMCLFTGAVLAAPTPTQNWVTNKIKDAIAPFATTNHVAEAVKEETNRALAAEQNIGNAILSTQQALVNSHVALEQQISNETNRATTTETAILTAVDGKQDKLVPLYGGSLYDGYAYNIRTVAAITANAAEMDNNGNVITVTYATKDELQDAVVGVDVSGQIEPLQNSVNRLMLQVQGSNVWFSVTNYFGSEATPSLSLFEIVDGVTKKVWDEKANHADTRAWAVEQMTNILAAALVNVPDRAWSLYTSGLGAPAPENTTWISTPTTVFAGGLEFQKFIDAAGMVAVLCNNGMAPQLAVNTNGYTVLRDLGGEELLEFRKTASYTIGANATGTAWNNGSLLISYDVASSEHPTLYCADSVSGPWYAETESDCPYTVVWSGSSGAWICAMTPKNNQSMGFAKADVLVEGRNEVRVPGVLNAESGILCTDGQTRVRPVNNNGTITWEVMQ